MLGFVHSIMRSRHHFLCLAWALDFYYAHKDDTAAQLVHAVLTNTQMWDQDLTKIEGLEAAVLADLEKIRTEGAEAAYKSCL